jgi:hypothetical protein
LSTTPPLTSSFEEAAIVEPIADRLLQRLELVAQAHQLAVLTALQLGAMRVDDPLRVFGLVRVHGEPHFAEAVDRQRKDRVRHVGGDHRHHAV